LKSTNGGDTWAINQQRPSRGGGSTYSIAIDPLSPETVYAAIGGYASVGIFQKQPMVAASGPTFFQRNNAVAVAVGLLLHHRQSNAAILGSLFKSNDGGSNLELFSSGLNSPNDIEIDSGEFSDSLCPHKQYEGRI